MTDFMLAFTSLRARWLNSLLSVFLTAFGVMMAILIMQFGHHVQNRVTADGKDIDIVVGAKGSPLQLILSSVYHIDIPTGNIAYHDAQKWMKHPNVRSAIPLALGDNWKNFRIVGTTPDYINHYNAALSQGRVWEKPFEAVAGSSVGLSVGDIFSGSHGLMAGGHQHENEKYTVTGILAPTGTVLDRLIITSLDSVLKIHGQDGVEEHHHHEHDHHHHHHAEEPEITALLLTTKSPITNINLPRSINRDTNLQAANPALEIARLTSMLGISTQTLSFLSFVLIAVAALSIFAGLAGSLDNRSNDLAVLRAIGYAKARLFKIIMTEGMIIVIAGTAVGFLFGYAGFSMLVNILTPLSTIGAKMHVSGDLILLILSVVSAGFIASLIPAVRASRVNVTRQLSRGM